MVFEIKKRAINNYKMLKIKVSYDIITRNKIKKGEANEKNKKYIKR